MKRIFSRHVIIPAILLLIALVWLINYWVAASTRMQLYNEVQAIPHRKVGLLLGTSKLLKDGSENLYYRYRIEAALALYHAGKIEYILVSGDNGREGYDETSAMQADLIAAGVPGSHVVCDYAGFRTLDSILRCKIIFGETSIIIISQPFHNERALFIANHKGMDAVAFNAHDVAKYYGFKVMMREKLARIKLLMDLAFNKGPKFYGPKVRIG